MSFGKLSNMFYRLPLELIAPTLLVSALCVVLIRRRWGSRRWFRPGCIGLLVLWLYTLLKLTVIGRSAGTEPEVLLIPFYYLWELHTTGNNELIRSTFMNVALFFPAGLLTALLLPRTWPGQRKVGVILGVFLGLSCTVELIQLVWVLGRVEMDDLIHNTLGALLGALPVLLEERLFAPPQQ